MERMKRAKSLILTRQRPTPSWLTLTLTSDDLSLSGIEVDPELLTQRVSDD
jgi:hypothetical protein